MNIERLVNVQISLRTGALTGQNFGSMLIAGVHCHSLNRVMTVMTIDDLVQAGFQPNEPVYMAARDALNQSPHALPLKIGRVEASNVLIMVQTALKNKAYVLNVTWKDSDGVKKHTYSYTSLPTDTAKEILKGLAANITADPQAGITATASDTEITIDGKVTTIAYTITAGNYLRVAYPDVTFVWAAELDAIRKEDSSWYGLIITERDDDDMLQVADWSETRTVQFACASDDPACLDPDSDTDIMSVLQDKNYFHSACWYHSRATTEWPDAALMSAMYALDPGTDAWGNQYLQGITADDLTETQYRVAFGKNGNTFEPLRNTAISQNGKVAAGEWCDVVRFRDYLEETIRVRIANVLIQRPGRKKLPYTDSGIGVIKANLASVLKAEQNKGGIAPDEVGETGKIVPGFWVKAPKAYEIPQEMKAKRHLPGVLFSARLSGAILTTEMRGELTYDMSEEA